MVRDGDVGWKDDRHASFGKEVYTVSRLLAPFYDPLASSVPIYSSLFKFKYLDSHSGTRHHNKRCRFALALTPFLGQLAERGCEHLPMLNLRAGGPTTDLTQGPTACPSV